MITTQNIDLNHMNFLQIYDFISCIPPSIEPHHPKPPPAQQTNLPFNQFTQPHHPTHILGQTHAYYPSRFPKQMGTDEADVAWFPVSKFLSLL